MKKVFLIIAALSLAVSAYAATDLARTPAQFINQTAIQTFAPDGTNNTILSVASKTVDLTNYLLYAVYSGSGTCYIRQMATSAKGAYVQVPISNTFWTIRAKNYTTPFVNMSGCVAGGLQYQ